jgi:hypothetical protein
MAPVEFSVTYDYRCPFARNAHEHLLDALEAGAPYAVGFLPFSLSQVHVEEGGTPVWDDPARAPDLLALEASVVVRDHFVDAFPAVHRALFTARHDEGRDLRRTDVVADVLAGVDLDPEKVFELRDEAARTVRAEHEAAAKDHDVWGVPTFIRGDRAAFVRLMTRPGGDGAVARRTLDRVIDLLAEAPELNEFKHTSLSQ